MTQDIFLLIEHIRGQVSDISYIMAAAARDLAKNEGCGVVGILFGSGAEGLKESLAVDKVIYCDHPALAEFSSDAYKRTLISLFCSGTLPWERMSAAAWPHTRNIQSLIPVSRCLTQAT